MRIRHSLGFLPKNLPGLRPFRNHQLFFALQCRRLDCRSKRRLNQADRNRAIKVRAAPLEKGVLLHFEKNIKIARSPTIRARFALARHAQTRARIHSCRDADFQSPLALDAALSPASDARVANHLPRTLARWASPRDREKPLLVGQLPVPVASAARRHSTARFRSGSFARFTSLVARDANLCVYSGRGFFERERHVVTQIRATLASLPATSAPPSAQHFLESEKAAEYVLKLFKNTGVESGIETAAAQSSGPVAVVDRTLLRIRQNRIRLARRSKAFLRLRLFLRIAIRVELQGGFAIRRLNLRGRSF